MAIALIVEDGTGIANANSYVTIDYALEHSKILNDSSFEDNVSLQIISLINASKFLDRRYGKRFLQVDTKSTDEQGLLFPLSSYVSGVPTCVKEATVMLSIIFINNGSLDVDNEPVLISNSVNVGNGAISESNTYASPYTTNSYKNVDFIMQDILPRVINQISIVRG